MTPQSVKDALADSLALETITRNVRPRFTATNVYLATSLGVGAVSVIVYTGDPERASDLARRAARYAFRAVPGLRGDR